MARAGRCVALVLVLAVIAAPLAAAPDKPFHDVPSGPRALPGDNLPPFAMRDEHGEIRLDPPPLPPGVTMPKPFGPPESDAPGPSLAVATRMAQAAVSACARSGHRVGVAVVDGAGEARALLTADGSDGSHVFVAMRKAEAALRFAAPSSRVNAMLRADPAAASKVSPAMFVEGGALPILRHGQVIGAIGVSGAAGLPIGAADEACATAGLRVGPQR